LALSDATQFGDTVCHLAAWQITSGSGLRRLASLEVEGLYVLKQLRPVAESP